MGFGVWGLVQGVGFRVWGLGLGFGFCNLGPGTGSSRVFPERTRSRPSRCRFRLRFRFRCRCRCRFGFRHRLLEGLFRENTFSATELCGKFAGVLSLLLPDLGGLGFRV